MIDGIVAHLWQSTLFAGAAWLVTLTLRANRAQVRYWVWFAASAKFLIPFSLLVGVGSFLPKPVAPPPVRAGWVAAIEDFSQPLALPAVRAGVAATSRDRSRDVLETGAAALWASGFLAIAIVWSLRWRRVHAIRQSAEAVRVAGIPVPVMSAPDLLEPGVFGIWRPVLLLPDGIRQQLSEAQWDAILAHECCHLRRRDNLTSVLHMAAQAIFWFHPMTWWIGARLVEERERACDEDVLRLGCKPSVYAESILAVCRLYLGSPLACVAGVTGADLKRRIEAIMRHRRAAGLNLAKRAALAAAGLAVLVAPMVVGFLRPAIASQDESDWQAKAGGKMAFEVASVKLDPGPFRPPGFPLDGGPAYRPVGGRFTADFALLNYIAFAYKLQLAPDQRKALMAHLPDWVATDRYDIQARAPGTPTKDQMRLMMQSLLADRFKLQVHFETPVVSALAMVLAKGDKPGPKLRPHSEGVPCEDTPTTNGPPPADSKVFPPICDVYQLHVAPDKTAMVGSRNTTMALIAGALPGIPNSNLDRPVVDRTGLHGRFDFVLEWTMPALPLEPAKGATPEPADVDLPGTPFLVALREQLGLKLESTKAPIRTLVVDRVERPSEN